MSNLVNIESNDQTGEDFMHYRYTINGMVLYKFSIDKTLPASEHQLRLEKKLVQLAHNNQVLPKAITIEVVVEL